MLPILAAQTSLLVLLAIAVKELAEAVELQEEVAAQAAVGAARETAEVVAGVGVEVEGVGVVEVEVDVKKYGGTAQPLEVWVWRLRLAL